jgi:SMI1 / KNR4 family (SUKH-1)
MKLLLFIKFLSDTPIVNDLVINNWAYKYGINMPEDFREYMLKKNGGYPKKSLYFNCSWNVEEFFLLEKNAESTHSSISNWLDINQSETDKLFPKDFIPFARDGGGEIYCVSTNYLNYGNIYFCRLDGERPEMIANSFFEFIEGLGVEYTEI